MTRKDFEMIAEAFADTVREWSANHLTHSETRIALEALKGAATFVADGLAQDNPRFDRARFMLACGFTD